MMRHMARHKRSDPPSRSLKSPMMIPTEPIGSIPRPPEMVAAVAPGLLAHEHPSDDLPAYSREQFPCDLPDEHMKLAAPIPEERA